MSPATRALAMCELFAGIAPATLTQIAQRARTVEVADGAVLVRQGDPSDAVYIVAEGALAVTRSGREVAIIGPGGTAGELGVLLTETRTASLIGRGATTVLAFANEDFRVLIARVPGVGLAVAQALAGRPRDAAMRIVLPAWSGTPDPEVAGLLPASFTGRHRVAPSRWTAPSWCWAACAIPNRT